MDNLAERVSHQGDQPHRFAPIVMNRAARRSGQTIKVVSFNARGGSQGDGIIACLRHEPLAGADVIMLCEADWRHRRSAWREFAADVATALGMSLAYLPQFGLPVAKGEPTVFNGNAILCSQPLEDVRAVPIPNRFLHSRLVRMLGGPAGVAAQARFHGRAIALGAVHLNSRWDPAGRDWQMREYLAKLPREGPAIIGGDLNTTTVSLNNPVGYLWAALKLLWEPRRLADPRKWEMLFARLDQAGFRVDGANAPGKRTFTFSRLLPRWFRPNLDWIAMRGLEPMPGSARAVAARPSFWHKRVSDHDFVMCEARL
jgi:endonuclease/exonuclease/phosphatase family metal-dependent hydrolase